ncbi:MAG: C25 family cysteine peptidase [Candidatus Thermoplasmatota archaeon]|nr:C25 family cysteine peptidase [Candidatus Thermoplasmatota archaeon]
MKQISLLCVVLILLSTQIIPIAESFENEIMSIDPSITASYHSAFSDNLSSEEYQYFQELNQEPNLGDKNVLFTNQSFMISSEDIHVLETNTNQYSLSLSDSILLNQPGLPLVPMKKILFSLPKNASVETITLHDYSLQKSIKPISYEPTPKPVFWSINETALHRHTDEIIETRINEAKQHTMYPGSTHSYIIGKNNTHTTVIVSLFPVHYHFHTEETFLITEGTLTVSYKLVPDKNTSYPLNQEDVENIIITPPLFYQQAQRLAQFHQNNGIQTSVVTTNWINVNFDRSPHPPFIGYNDFSFRGKIRKFDEDLSLKIITFLQIQSTNPHLQFVTIFGNAIHVPPSYYFGYEYYPVPTDFFYASPDLDLIQNYRIGRLPVNSIVEAKRTVDKIIEWNPTAHQMDNVAIAGGIPFYTPFYIGELITIDSMNQGFFDGLHVDKYFRTDDRFNDKDILSALQNQYGLLYMICHGNANLVAVEHGRISSRTLKNMPKNTQAPILSCIACSGGSFDTRVIKQGYSLDKTSFGEGVVVSKGGGIAYIGGSRTNSGYPIFSLNNGRVEISKETYMAGLLTYVNEAYKNNVDHLGDLTMFAKETFLKNNDMTDFWNLYHYFGFVLLGDPALVLPERVFQHESHQQPETSASKQVEMLHLDPRAYGYNGSISLHAIDEETIYESITDSPFINLKRIKTGNYNDVEVSVSTHATQEGKATIRLTPKSGPLTLLRFESIDGKEDWVYYEAARPVDDDYTFETTGFGITRWNTIQGALNNAQPNDLIYVFEGTYPESITIENPCILQGEKKNATIIDGVGNDDVIHISSDDVIISGFTIKHCGNNPWNAGISIQPNRSLRYEPIIIENNIIKDNKNCGIYINVPHRLSSTPILIFNNEIIHNNFGIYVQQCDSKADIMFNTLSGNNYGLYIVESKKDSILGNTIENNYVGLFFNDVKRTDIVLNNFIDNTQHCQFTKTTLTRFSSNYWDDWIGLRFNMCIPIPKMINGIHDLNNNVLPQVKIDFRPLNEPFSIDI